QKRKAQMLGNAHAATFRLKIPQRTVEGIAGRARGQQRGELGPDHAAGDGACARFDRHDNSLHALAVARIGHAFAPPRVRTVVDRGDHHDRLVLRAARDGESAFDRKALDADGEPQAYPHDVFLSPGFSFKNSTLLEATRLSASTWQTKTFHAQARPSACPPD